MRWAVDGVELTTLISHEESLVAPPVLQKEIGGSDYASPDQNVEQTNA